MVGRAAIGDPFVFDRINRYLKNGEIIERPSLEEKYKCFLKGKWKDRVLIAVPSFNPLLEGTNVLEGRMLSPYLKKIDDFEVFVVNKGEVFDFGLVSSFKN